MYSCVHCERDTETANTITRYDEKGIEEGLDTICRECYEEWLQSMKG